MFTSDKGAGLSWAVFLKKHIQQTNMLLFVPHPLFVVFLFSCLTTAVYCMCKLRGVDNTERMSWADARPYMP